MILHDGVILTKSGRRFSKPRNYKTQRLRVGRLLGLVQSQKNLNLPMVENHERLLF